MKLSLSVLSKQKLDTKKLRSISCFFIAFYPNSFFFIFLEGEDFWNVPAKKIFAVSLSNYQRKKRQGERGKGKNKRFVAESKPSHLPVLEEISEKLDKLTETVEANNLSCRSITENFQCCICMKIAQPLTVSGCCQRLLGCESCVERWFERDNRCPVCKNVDGRDKHFVLKGVEDFAVLISKLNAQD